jgi:hypothetical protein
LLVAAIAGGLVSWWRSASFGELGLPGWLVRAALLLAAGFAIGLVPVGEVDLSGQFLAVSGELSFTTLAYLAAAWARASGLGCGRPGSVAACDVAPMGTGTEVWAWRPRPVRAEQAFWAILGLALYLPALSGVGPDVYGLGYGSVLGWATLALTAGLAYSGHWGLAALGVGVVLSWQARLSGAVNFWNYAIDPFVFIGSAAQILGGIGGVLLGRAKTARTNRGHSLKMESVSVGD